MACWCSVVVRCPNCGVDVDEGSTDCPVCGTSLLRDRYWCWSCLRGIGKDEPIGRIRSPLMRAPHHYWWTRPQHWWTQHLMLFQRRSEIKWVIFDGKATPFCPHCHTNLIHQPRALIAKSWMRYALTVLCIFVLLRIVAQLVEWF